MSEFQPRNPDANLLLWFLGGAALLILCVGSVLLVNQFNRRSIVVSPTPASLPKVVFVPISSPTALKTLTYPTPLFTVMVPARVIEEVAPTSTSTSTGEPCRYGPSWINALATPVPDGGHSKYEDYLCVNGYWYLGTKDWVDGRTGGWGTDGIDERMYITYNADGSVADRKFINLQGTAIPGPNK